jgi:hypothetical protein
MISVMTGPTGRAMATPINQPLTTTSSIRGTSRSFWKVNQPGVLLNASANDREE